MIQCKGRKYFGRRVPKKNAIPTIFPQKSKIPEDINKFDEAVSLRKNIESVQHDHDYLGEKRNPWTDSVKQSQKLDLSKSNPEYFEGPPMNELEIERHHIFNL